MVISFVFALFSILLTFLCSGSFASFLMATFIFVSGQLFCRFVNRESRYKGRLLFNIVFSCLTIFACIHYYDTVVDWAYFAQDWNDEYKFWSISEILSKYPSINRIFVDCFIERNVGGLIENQGYVFYIGFLGYIAENFLDGNHLLLQFIGSVLFGSLSSILLYKIFLNYFDKNKSFNHVLIFSLCCVVFSYGFAFLRDIVVYFFYALMIYLTLSKFSVSNLIKLICLSFIVFQLRFEHGLFPIMFIAYYIYRAFNKIKILIPFIMVCLIVIFFTYFSEFLDTALNSMDNYKELTSDAALSKSGLSAYIFTLPPFIKEIVLFFYVPITPFPPTFAVSQTVNMFGAIVESHTIIYEFFWFIVFYLMLKWLIFDKKIKQLPSEIIWLFALSIIFLILNLSNPNHRRLMAVYPIIYLAYCLIKDKMPRNVVNKNKWALIGIYAFGVIAYMILKA
jgi:hypothetical protein